MLWLSAVGLVLPRGEADVEVEGVVGGEVPTRAEMVGAGVVERGVAAGVSTVVFDRGAYKYHGRVKALADAAREGGLQF